MGCVLVKQTFIKVSWTLRKDNQLPDRPGRGGQAGSRQVTSPSPSYIWHPRWDLNPPFRPLGAMEQILRLMIQLQLAEKEQTPQLLEALLATHQHMKEDRLAKQEWNWQSQAEMARLLEQGLAGAPMKVFPA